MAIGQRTILEGMGAVNSRFSSWEDTVRLVSYPLFCFYRKPRGQDKESRHLVVR